MQSSRRRIAFRRALGLAVLALGLAPSCFVSRESLNEPLRTEELARLEPGVTTAREAVELLGGPSEVVQLGFRSAYLYRHQVTKRQGLFLIVFGAMNQEGGSDRTWLFFDEEDLLTHVGTTLGAGEPDYRMPWDVRREEGRAARDAELAAQRTADEAADEAAPAEAPAESESE